MGPKRCGGFFRRKRETGHSTLKKPVFISVGSYKTDTKYVNSLRSCGIIKLKMS